MGNLVTETLKQRRSIRFYKDTPVEQEKLDEILECGTMSPNGKGMQAWHFTVVRDRGLLDEISEANRQLMLASGNPGEIEKASEPGFDCFRTAPMAIILSGDTASPYYVQDCAISAMAMAVAAESLGLNTCYVVSFSKVLLMEEGRDYIQRLGIPEGHVPVCALCMGYRSKEPNPRKPRKNAVNYVD